MWLQFLNEIREEGVLHGFRLRGGEGNIREDLRVLGFSPMVFIAQGEQVHGNRVVCVNGGVGGGQREGGDGFFAGVDALITRDEGVALVIRTADCAPVFLWDGKCRAVGLAHSGRRGTEANILKEVVRAMGKHWGSEPQNMVVGIGPCIRPPFYEVDFAAVIREQAYKAGVKKVRDCGLNTGEDLRLFYSYRMERGQTGRHLSVIGIFGKGCF
jgi:copper oxidase (laccase) domain-containing protein